MTDARQIRTLKKMLRITDVLDRLIAACPSFAPSEPVYGVPYLDAVRLSDHLIERIASGDVGALPAVFRVVERVLLEGDPEAQSFLTLGILEPLYRGTSGRFDPEIMRAQLGRESSRWWSEVAAFCRGERQFLGEGLIGDTNLDSLRNKIQDRRGSPGSNPTPA